MDEKRELKHVTECASAATEDILQIVRDAGGGLGGHATNGHGIFCDPQAVRAALMNAREKLSAAIDLHDSVYWPADAEYDSL